MRLICAGLSPAGGSTATIAFRIDGDVKSFQIRVKDAEGWRKVPGMAAPQVSLTAAYSRGIYNAVL